MTMNAPSSTDDPILAALIAEAEADPDVIGLILCGSRGAGAVHPESDYDVAFVVTDAAYDGYGGEAHWPVRGATVDPPIDEDIWHECPRTLTQTHQAEWSLPGWVEGRVIFDRGGETAKLFQALITIPPEAVRTKTAELYDAYLNSLYRSLKAWRRGNDLGGRMHAALSAQFLVALLFTLEGRIAPYLDRLHLHLDTLDQGWRPGELRAALLDLLATGDPRRQQALARRVAALLGARGFQKVYDDWEGQIDQILAWPFDETLA